MRNIWTYAEHIREGLRTFSSEEREPELHGVEGDETDFRGETLEYLVVRYESIENVDFTLAQIFNGHFDGSFFGSCNFNGVRFKGTKIEDSEFESCSMGGARFTALRKFAGNSFKNCDLRYTLFDSSAIENSIQSIDGRRVYSLSFLGCDLTGSNILNFIDPEFVHDKMFDGEVGELVRKKRRSRSAFGRF
jgi:uncharacterized protein YjbI with pentapeptide repeats